MVSISMKSGFGTLTSDFGISMKTSCKRQKNAKKCAKNRVVTFPFCSQNQLKPALLDASSPVNYFSTLQNVCTENMKNSVFEDPKKVKNVFFLRKKKAPNRPVPTPCSPSATTNPKDSWMSEGLLVHCAGGLRPGLWTGPCGVAEGGR